ncbi:MAG: hypothetical protein LQ347_003410 [Umbilicaria vellea]|nr:MAG: hypothetical protein LQ347_003410 [Umbilicaria vellea]
MASSKRQADDSPEGAGTPKRSQILIHSDDTPRAMPGQRNDHSLINYQPLNPPREPSSLSSDDLTRSSASQRSRSSSPIKNLNALWMTENPVERSNEILEIPSSGQELYKELSRCKTGKGVMPSALKNEITAAIGIADYLLDFMFDSAVTSDLDLPTELAQVQVILRRAEKCQILQDAEPGWNEKVHCRVLELALGEQGSVDFQNITTAKIYPAAFKPKHVNGMFLQGKMVDYAICLESDSADPMFDRMRNALRSEPLNLQYINHTSFEPVRFRPIAVSIETKVAGNEADATTQLSVWVVAHFKCLQAIMQRSGACLEMMVLPLINPYPLSVGHETHVTAIRIRPKVILINKASADAASAPNPTFASNAGNVKTTIKPPASTKSTRTGKTGPAPTSSSKAAGYSSHVRPHEHWFSPIPAALEPARAALIPCACLTASSPLVRTRYGLGKQVGTVGLGGIGHSVSYPREPSASSVRRRRYAGGAGPEVESQDLVLDGVLVCGSHLRSRKERLEMSHLAADLGMKSWVEAVQISEENLSQAV